MRFITIIFLLAANFLNAQSNNCLNPRPASLRIPYELDMIRDDELNGECPEWTACLDPYYDIYHGYTLTAGAYLTTVYSASGAGFVYVAILGQGCDTIFGEYCGFIPVELYWNAPYTGNYTVLVNSRDVGPFYMVTDDADTTIQPYINPMALCNPVTRTDKGRYPLDSSVIYRQGALNVWQYSRNGRILGHRKIMHLK